MSKLNGTGPENNGEIKGRGLGQCSKVETDEALEKIGKGMGLRRQSGGGQGQGKRRKAGLKYIQEERNSLCQD